jgi:hypothetical protein
MPKGAYDRAASAWRPPPRAVYAPELVEAVRRLYLGGHTMAETAALAGTTVKVLQRLMPRHGITRRPAVKRDQAGPANSSWRGDQATYTALHLRVAEARGKPSACEQCGTSGPGQPYEWANLTGRYEDVNDYARMCAACHRAVDGARRAITGEPTTPARLRRW